METYVDSVGHKRKGIKVSCHTCQKSFLTRKDQAARYCSRKCFHSAQRRRVTHNCAYCGKLFELRQSRISKSGLHCCSKKCKDRAQRIGGVTKMLPSHYGTGSSSASYRAEYHRLTGLEKLACGRCGYDEFECGIDIHHLDSDRQNNKKENLFALCAPCHRALHNGLWQIENGGVAQLGER